MPANKSMPSTVRRSSGKARRTWAKTFDAAVEQYGDGERSHRTAFAALKHSFEKVGDRWERKEGGKTGPSDKQSGKKGQAARKGGKTAGGVDTTASKKHLLKLARRLDIKGRSGMKKAKLVKELQKANNRKTAKKRKSS